MKKRKSTIISRMFEEAGEVELVEVKVLKRIEGRYSRLATEDTAPVQQMTTQPRHRHEGRRLKPVRRPRKTALR